MDIDKLEKQLIRHEAMRLKPYRCSAGKLTIGVGRNIEEKGITEHEARYLLISDILESFKDLARMFPNWWCFPENIRLVLGDMRFNLGPVRFRAFKKMIAAAMHNDWPAMKQEMIDSAWYGQVGQRSRNLVAMVDEVIKKLDKVK